MLRQNALLNINVKSRIIILGTNIRKHLNLTGVSL